MHINKGEVFSRRLEMRKTKQTVSRSGWKEIMEYPNLKRYRKAFDLLVLSSLSVRLSLIGFIVTSKKGN